MHRQREDLIRQHHQASESRELQASLDRETAELDRLIKDALKDKRDVENEIRAIAEALQSRADRLSQQLSELDRLTQEKGQRKRELESLNYQVKDL